MKAEDNFSVSWSSVTYSKTLRNPKASPTIQIPKVSEAMSLDIEVAIADPNRVLGAIWEPVIEKITNGKGEDIMNTLVLLGTNRTQYEHLSYRSRYVKPKPAWWKMAVRSLLRLSPKQIAPGRRIEVLKPCHMQLQLKVGSNKEPEGGISLVKGHFRALVAESLEYVEVPFKPSEDWVRLTPDLEIQLHHTQCTERQFGFSIRTRPHEAASMRKVSVQDYLPDRIVVARELIVKDGKRSQHPLGIQRLPDDILRGINAAGRDCLIESIRFLIAVNPRHRKIPFVLEDIPSPKP
jgi:hypothetical protein